MPPHNTHGDGWRKPGITAAPNSEQESSTNPFMRHYFPNSQCLRNYLWIIYGEHTKRVSGIRTPLEYVCATHNSSAAIRIVLCCPRWRRKMSTLILSGDKTGTLFCCCWCHSISNWRANTHTHIDVVIARRSKRCLRMDMMMMNICYVFHIWMLGRYCIENNI